LLYDELKRPFTNKTELRNLNLAVLSGRKKRKSFPPKLNLSALANCAMFADEYRNIQTEKMESEFPNFLLNFDFENLENVTLNKRVEKKAEEELGKSVEDQVNANRGRLGASLACGFNRAINTTGFLIPTSKPTHQFYTLVCLIKKLLIISQLISDCQKL
ncbi:hypothetical protein ACROYT_G020256, partial [Oculina patagonica]